MESWRSKICALAILLVLTPVAVEIVENGTHLVTEGHLAHAPSDGDRHGPTGPEHGCTPIFHVCGCHASLALLGGPSPSAVSLGATGFVDQPISSRRSKGYWPAMERPPRV